MYNTLNYLVRLIPSPDYERSVIFLYVLTSIPWRPVYCDTRGGIFLVPWAAHACDIARRVSTISTLREFTT